MPLPSSARLKRRLSSGINVAGIMAREWAPDNLVGRDVFDVLGYEPTERQQEFHGATEFSILYGGAAGGGKSKALIMEGIRACMKYPRIRVGAFRRTFPELEESLLAELAQLGYCKGLGAKWRAQKHDLTFPNGSVLMFRYARNMQDATMRQGGQYQLLLFDELTLFPPDVVSFICSRLRSGSSVPVIGMRAGSNPGGIGHAAVRKDFIDSTAKGTKVITDKRGRTLRFIPSKVDDNPHVNAEYKSDLDALPAAMRAAFRDGSWDSFSGQVFCYDNKVDMLTGAGWKSVADVQQGELVATLAPSGEMTFAPATAVYRFPFEGDLHVHEGRALNFAVTPGHKMWTRGYKSTQPFGFVPVEELPETSVHLRAASEWHGESPATITIKAPRADVVDVAPEVGCLVCGTETAVTRKGMCENCYRPWNRAGRPDDLTDFRAARANSTERFARHKSYTFDTGDWCELLGWYLSEGFTTKASGGSRYAGRIYGFGIAQHTSQAKIDRIGELLTRMGFRHTFGRSRYRVGSRVLGEYFAQFGHHADKFIPRESLDLDTPHLQRLFDALMAGDGHRSHTGGWLYASASRQLADDVQELCVRLNLVATIAEVAASGRRNTSYRVSVYKPGHDRSILRSGDIKREAYNDEVSCVTVEPHHTVLVRRGGKAMWCGNTEWNDERHIVPRFKIPPSWRRLCGIDYGWTAPWVVLWMAVDNDGRIWLYREITATQVVEKEQGKRILDAEAPGENVTTRAADPAMWARTGEALSVASQYASVGCRLVPGQNDRLIGKQRIHTHLSEGPACLHHRGMGWETCPKLHVLEGTCPELVRTLPSLPYDPKHPEDVDTNAEDHHYDALRYGVLGIGKEASRTFLNALSDVCDGCSLPSPRGAKACLHCGKSFTSPTAE